MGTGELVENLKAVFTVTQRVVLGNIPFLLGRSYRMLIILVSHPQRPPPLTLPQIPQHLSPLTPLIHVGEDRRDDDSEVCLGRVGWMVMR